MDPLHHGFGTSGIGPLWVLNPNQEDLLDVIRSICCMASPSLRKLPRGFREKPASLSPNTSGHNWKALQSHLEVLMAPTHGLYYPQVSVSAGDLGTDPLQIPRVNLYILIDKSEVVRSGYWYILCVLLNYIYMYAY